MVYLADILKLSVDDRIRLVEEVWDSLAANPESVPLSLAQREEIDRRLDAHQQHPDAGSHWAEVKARIAGDR